MCNVPIAESRFRVPGERARRVARPRRTGVRILSYGITVLEKRGETRFTQTYIRVDIPLKF